jgi:hypothetical protein
MLENATGGAATPDGTNVEPSDLSSFASYLSGRLRLCHGSPAHERLPSTALGVTNVLERNTEG